MCITSTGQQHVTQRSASFNNWIGGILSYLFSSTMHMPIDTRIDNLQINFYSDLAT